MREELLQLRWTTDGAFHSGLVPASRQGRAHIKGLTPLRSDKTMTVYNLNLNKARYCVIRVNFTKDYVKVESIGLFKNEAYEIAMRRNHSLDHFNMCHAKDYPFKQDNEVYLVCHNNPASIELAIDMYKTTISKC